MAKLTINVGTNPNDRKGDSLRAAFQKVNANFTELYTAIGLNVTPLNLGAFEFTGSTMSTTDSTPIVIDQATTVTSDLTVGGDIVPSVANGGNLGSLAKPFRSLYVSNNTVFLGGVPLSLEPGTNELRVNNIPISQNISYTDIPNAPTDISDLTDTEGLLGGGGGGDVLWNWQGAYSAGPMYQEGDIVEHLGSTYRRNGTGNSVVGFPPPDAIYWELVSEKGERAEEDRLVNGTKTVILGSDGTLTLPPQSATLTDVNQIATAKIYRATNSTNATAIQEAKDTWFGNEILWEEVRDQDEQFSGVTRPWSGMPSYEAYPVLMNYNHSGPGLPPANNLAPTANTAKNAYLLWKELVSNIDIVSGDKTFSFENTGNLRVPGVVTSDDLLTLNSGGTASFNSAAVLADGDNGNVLVKTRDGNGGTEKTWTFSKEGNLALPAGGDILDSTGNSVLGGSADQLSNTGEIFTLSSDGDVTFSGPTGGINRGLVWDYGAVIDNGTNSTVRQDNFGLSVKAWTTGDGGGPTGGSDNGYSAPVNIRTNQGDNEKWWTFDGAGNLTLPTGGDIVDENGDSVLGGGVASLTDDKEVKITVGNTEYWAIVNRANNNDNGVESSAVAYDSEDNMVTLHVSEVGIDQDEVDILIISKYDTSANLLWQKQIVEDVDVDSTHDICFDGDDNIIIATSVDNGDDIDTVNILKLSSAGSIQWQKSYRGDVTTEVIDTVSLVDGVVGTDIILGTEYDTILLIGDLDINIDPSGWVFQESTDQANWTTLGTVSAAQYNGGNSTTTLRFPDGTLIAPTDFENRFYRIVGDAVNSFQEVGAVVYDDGYIYVGGYYRENSEEEFGAEGLILKVDGDDGSLVYAKTFTLPGASTFFFGMDVGADGNPVVIGKIEDDGGPRAAFASKIDGSDGSHLWTRVLVDLEVNIDYSGGDVVVDSQNNVFISVNSNQEIATENGFEPTVTIAHVMKLNSSGVVQWMRRIGPGPCASVATGIDCDDSGNIYLSALTVAQDNPNRDTDNFFETARNVLAIAKYSTAGAVLWQRYIEAEGYWFTDVRDQDGGPPGLYNYDYLNRGRYLSLNSSGKLAIQATVQQKDLDENGGGDIYYESITFQIDQDGRQMTIGSGNEKFTVKESRIPGKFIDIPTDSAEGGDLSLTDITNVSVTTSTLTLADGEMAQQTAKSAPYEYVFGNDGTLTIPNDGDVRLTQTQIGWFSIFGPANNSDDDVDIRCNVVDASTGDVYVAGQSDDYEQGFVARYNSQGQILWSIRLTDDDEGYSNRCNAIKLHPDTGNVVVLCEYYGNETGILVVEIDPDTAKVVRSFGVRDQDESQESIAYDFDFFSNGDVAIVGRKYDEYRQISVTPITGSTTSTLIINKATVTEGPLPISNSWYMYGTGITGRTTIQYVNRYTGLTGTVREGTGATFDIQKIGGNYTVIGTSGGTFYRDGHKVKILGTDLGGATPDNDLILTVVTNGSGAVIGTDTQEGVATSGTDTYSEVSGTNYNVGSGFQIDIDYGNTTDYNGAGYYNLVGGSNYVVGDVITVAGTSLGGTSPTNDMTVTVATVDGSGAITDFTRSGTAQDTTVKIQIAEAVDFGGSGSWSVAYGVGGEAFVLRYSDNIVWTKVLSAGGANDDERYLSVAVDSSDNIYAAGEMIARNNVAGADLNSYWCAVVSKFNSSGAHQWTKALNTTLNDSYAKSVVVRGTTVVVSHNENGYNTIVTKLDTSGNVKWQRTTYSMDDSSVAIDTNGDIYAVIETNLENKYEDVIKLIRFASNGEISYRKFFGTLTDEYGGTNENFKNGRNLTIDADHVYVSGYTSAFADGDNNGFLVKLPKTGDCDGYYGAWTVQSDIYDVDKVTSTEATTFTPVVGTGNWETWTPDFVTDWWDPSGNDYYHTFQEIRDRDGGAIEFADGTRQTSSAQQIPQRKIDNGADHRLCLEDMGKHIYVTNSDTTINVPYDEDNPLPIGFTVVIVNYSGGTISIDADGAGLTIIVPGVGSGQYWDLDSPGMATLIKVEEYTWFMTGNVELDN